MPCNFRPRYWKGSLGIMYFFLSTIARNTLHVVCHQNTWKLSCLQHLICKTPQNTPHPSPQSRPPSLFQILRKNWRGWNLGKKSVQSSELHRQNEDLLVCTLVSVHVVKGYVISCVINSGPFKTHCQENRVLCTGGKRNEMKNMPVPSFICIDLDVQSYASQFDKRLNINRRIINLTKQINTTIAPLAEDLPFLPWGSRWTEESFRLAFTTFLTAPTMNWTGS